jgi:hypothetical protein
LIAILIWTEKYAVVDVVVVVDDVVAVVVHVVNINNRTLFERLFFQINLV